MDKLAVAGDAVVLHPVGFVWQGWDGKLPLGGDHPITADGKSVVIEADVMAAALQGLGKLYVAPPFATPGSIVALQLVVTIPTMSMAVSVNGQKVVTAATLGTYTASVVPAMNPQGVPDPLLVKTGQWSIEATSQSVFSSGIPLAVAAEGSSAEDKGEGEASERDEHWVGVSVELSDGTPCANQDVFIELPSAQSLTRTLGETGAVRVDEIPTSGKCLVRMVFDPRRVPVRASPTGFIAVQFVDDDGTPYAGREVTLQTPDGPRTQVLNSIGRTRFENIPLGARCSATLVPLRVLLELQLADEEGLVLSGIPYTVVDCQGAKYEGKLDAEGAARVEVAEGECDVSFDLDNAQVQVEGQSVGSGVGIDVPAERRSDDAPEVDERHVGHVLEVLSSLFRLESAVVMPEGEDPSQSGHGALTMANIFATAVRYNEEQPDKKLFVAGHADTSGDRAVNQALSRERAELVLALLQGNRARFAELAHERHMVADYKQILSWCSSVYGEFFSCDPGAIDDIEFTGVEPLERFQAQYNSQLQALGGQREIDVDGSMGPQTWGAFFDVYQLNLARELGEEPNPARLLQQQLRFVDNDRPALGFGEHHPSKVTGDHQREQANRRVQILFFDPEDEPDLAGAEADPIGTDLFSDKYRLEPIPVPEGAAKAHMDFVLQLSRPEGVRSGLRYQLTNAVGSYARTLSEADAESAGDELQLVFRDVPMASPVTLEAVAEQARLVMFLTVLPRDLLEERMTIAAQVAAQTPEFEKDTAFLQYPVREALR